MADIRYQAEPEAIRGRRIAIVGYGSQGRAHALNLRDSGCEVRVGLVRRGRSWAQAEADGFVVAPVAEVSGWADLISILLPDHLHRQVFAESIAPQLSPGKLLLFAHGFSINFGQIIPPATVDVALVAPVSPGHLMRQLFVDGIGVPAVFAVAQDVSGQAEAVALAYAWGLGCTRAGVVRSTFREETETDLFGEQAVLCGGLAALVKAGFEALVDAGYQPELAYFECVHQVKLLGELIQQGGLVHMYSRISDTAEFGAYLSGPRVIDEHVRRAMDDVLRDIQDGTFARRLVAEFEAGGPTFQQMRGAERAHLMEKVGRRLRAMMPWLGRRERATPRPSGSRPGRGAPTGAGEPS